MPEIKTLISVPVSFGGYAPPGSLQDKCSKCGQTVWVAPSILEYHPQGRIVKQHQFELKKAPSPSTDQKGLKAQGRH